MTKSPIYLLIGVPASGKSWIGGQLAADYTYLPHDDHRSLTDYLDLIHAVMSTDHNPLLIETPFSVSKIMDPLTAHGFDVIPVFIHEPTKTLSDRHRARYGAQLEPRYLTQQSTYLARAREWDAFVGTSSQVLTYLKGLRSHV